MQYQNTPPLTDARAIINFGIRQELQQSPYGEITAGTQLWKVVAKVVALFIPIVLAINLYSVFKIRDIEKQMLQVEDQHHESIDKNIGLRAQKARIYAPESINQLAAEKLSLFTAEPGQIERLN